MRPGLSLVSPSAHKSQQELPPTDLENLVQLVVTRTLTAPPTVAVLLAILADELASAGAYCHPLQKAAFKLLRDQSSPTRHCIAQLAKKPMVRGTTYGKYATRKLIDSTLHMVLAFSLLGATSHASLPPHVTHLLSQKQKELFYWPATFGLMTLISQQAPPLNYVDSLPSTNEADALQHDQSVESSDVVVAQLRAEMADNGDGTKASLTLDEELAVEQAADTWEHDAAPSRAEPETTETTATLCGCQYDQLLGEHGGLVHHCTVQKDEVDELHLGVSLFLV